MTRTLATWSETLPAATVAEMHAALERNAEQLTELFKQITEARRIQAGACALRLMPVELGALAREVVADLAPVTAPRRVDVVAPHPVVAHVDEQRVRQILANLLSNTARFTPATTTVSISVRRVDDTVEIVCRDDGPGIPQDRQAALFSMFERLGSSSPGLGLGLFVSRGLARAHLGELYLDADAETGCRFVLRLPLFTPMVRSGGASTGRSQPADSPEATDLAQR